MIEVKAGKRYPLENGKWPSSVRKNVTSSIFFEEGHSFVAAVYGEADIFLCRLKRGLLPLDKEKTHIHVVSILRTGVLKSTVA